MVAVKVFSHDRTLRGMPPDQYLAELHRLVDQTFAAEAWGPRAARTALRAATPTDVSSIPAALAALDHSGMAEIAARELAMLVKLQPPETPVVECHLFPCLNPAVRGGFCYAPGKMLVNMPLIDRWETRLVRNITHEYSHTLRQTRWPADERWGFGPPFPHTIREFLVMEGLADNLVEQLHSDPDFPQGEISPQDEERFWGAVAPHFDKVSWEAYGAMMSPASELSRPLAYTIGYRIVRSYLQAHGLTALAAQWLPYDELYWQSRYEMLQ